MAQLGNCACCGKAIFDGNFKIYDGSHYFCRPLCQKEFLKKSTSAGAAASGGSGGSGLSAGDAAALAGAGIGAAAAGAGAALKGIGALAKGAGSLFGALGKGVGAAVEGTQKQFGATHSAEAEIIAINNKVFSSDPEEYKKEIWALFDKATSKPADPLRDTFVIKAAKKKLIHELDVCKLKNPEMFSQFANLYEELTKKKKLFGLFG
ncbi:MAG: hypothetical protein J6V90_04240 [Treponema sp.]|nr:hypothetical protein [Treponema sp.]